MSLFDKLTAKNYKNAMKHYDDLSVRTWKISMKTYVGSDTLNDFSLDTINTENLENVLCLITSFVYSMSLDMREMRMLKFKIKDQEYWSSIKLC